MADARSFEADYLDEVRRSFRGYKRLADGGLVQLTDPDFFKAPDTESNCVAQIVFDNIAALKPADFVRTVTIRNEPHTILQAINRSAMHTAYHVGQILYVGKHLRGSEWTVLSIPKGKSKEFNAMKPEDRKVKLPNRP